MTGTDAATYTRERPGMSAFVLEDGVVYHTYSTYARGLDGLWGMYQWLDRAPKGRNETGIWWRRHGKMTSGVVVLATKLPDRPVISRTKRKANIRRRREKTMTKLNMGTTSKERDKEHGKGHLAMKTPPIVSQQEWEAARQQLLVKEKALTRSRDALAAERRRMPWMAVEKKYEFDGPKGKVSLLDLFEGRRQLIVYRAFFEPGVFGWPEHACRGCSLGADQVAHLAHLNARDTTLAYASRAPQADIARLKARMGWKMPWYTITDSFDTDFGVDRVARPQRVLPRRRARCSAHTSSTTAATRRWGAPGATSTSRRSAVRRLGRTRRRVTPRPRRTSGGTGTTTTTPRPRLTRSGST